jgi:hypothetical protein
MTDVQSNSDTSNNNDNDEHDTTATTTTTTAAAAAKQQQKSTITKSTPSFLSPVGAMSRNYSVALDEDDLMDLSPNHSSRINNNVSNNNTNNNNNNNNWNDRYWESDYEANYNGIQQQQVVSTDEEYKYNDNNYDIIDNDNDLPTPLLGRNRNRNRNDSNDDEDDDDHYYHHRHHDRRRNNQHDHQQRQQQQQQQHHAKPKLNGLNYLNVITYVLNVFTSYFIGVRGLFGVLPTRRDIFIEYETLVTPADYAYYLWAPILVFEFFFATAQLFPHYRARPIIQQGTGLYFFWACIIQTIWTIFFAMKWFISSFVAVCLALLCLVLLLASQHYNCLSAPTTRGGGGMTGTMGGFLSSSSSSGPTQRRKKSLLEYWLFRFPFYLHCGWLLVCTVVQFSMVFRYRFTGSSGAQLMADIVALGVLLPPSTFFLTGQSSSCGPDFVIPLVIIWSYISIGVELHNPSDKLVELYGHPAIIAVQNASYVFTGIIVFMLIPRIIVWIAQEFCTIDVVELIDEEEDNISTAMNEVRRTGGLFQRVSLRGRGGGGGGGSGTSFDQSMDDDDDDDHNNNSNDDGHLPSVSRRIIEDGDDEQHEEVVEENDGNNNVNQKENENTNSDEEAITEVTEEEDNCKDEEKNEE